MEKYLCLHTIAFLLGILADRIIGDPHKMPHPIRLIGTCIGKLDHSLMPQGYIPGSHPESEKRKGTLLVVIVVTLTALVTGSVIAICYRIHDVAGVVAEVVLTCYILAAKSLKTESMAVAKCLAGDDVEGARYAVSMIVGRDTNVLDATGIAKAAVETVAENASDGVIVPLLYTYLGGPLLGMTYKAVNTMDSMIGYHNDRYEYFGSVAARLDDAANYLPSRICALFMIVAAGFVGLDRKESYRIWKRDRRNHKSPNSAQTESVCAGALGLQLAGDAVYFGKVVKKPTIGDAKREITCQDIEKANQLMYATENLAVICCMLLTGIICYLL